MIPRGSRYSLSDAYPSKDPGRTGGPGDPALAAATATAIDGVQPRRSASPAEPLDVRRQHLVASHERLDTLAERYYSDPLMFWLICDANETIFPDDLMVPGRVLRIPRSQR
jgi:nucleoid-associated protein YgaU